MEILLAITVGVAIIALVYFNRNSKGFDVNNDGKVDASDVKAAVQNTLDGVKAVADANNDGKVDIKDVKAAAKSTAAKAKTAVDKASGRRPAAKKVTKKPS